MRIKRLIVYSIFFTAILQTQGRGEILFGEDNNFIDSVRNSIIFISDTQAPMGFEKIFVRTHNNEEATKIIFNAIVGDSTVASIFMLGDITAMSSFDHNWATIDSFLTDLKARRISAHAAAGNHDYLLTSSKGEANLSKRFPDFKRTGYTVQVNSLSIILLNSNFKRLSHSEKKQQLEWYINELHTLDQDTTVKLIAVGCHHSPFSNSSIVGSDKDVRDTFIQPFLKSKKSRLFISGHAHTFQYFKDTVEDKHFLVIGGGGLLHKLKAGEPDELKDQVDWSTEYRMFHYVRGVFTPDGLLLNVMMLNEDLTGPKSAFELLIPFNHR